MPEGIGNSTLCWKDNDGSNHERVVEDFCHTLNSPLNMLIISKLSQQIEGIKMKNCELEQVCQSVPFIQYLFGENDNSSSKVFVTINKFQRRFRNTP